MKTNFIFYCILILAAIQVSCSEQLQRKYDQKHGTTSASSRYDDSNREVTRTSPNMTGKDAYKRDYDKMMEEDIKSDEIKTDFNAKFVSQYEDMDKVGELVLYEIDILESRWKSLLGEYRSAKGSQKDVISDELDKIGEDRLVLYKAYTNIYRNGKTNWPVVKQEVENTLRSVRRVSDR